MTNKLLKQIGTEFTSRRTRWHPRNQTIQATFQLLKTSLSYQERLTLESTNLYKKSKGDKGPFSERKIPRHETVNYRFKKIVIINTQSSELAPPG